MNKLTEMVRAKVDLDEAAKPTKMAHIYYSPLGKKMVGSKKVGAVPRKDLNTELKRLAKAHKATVQDFEYYDRDLGESLEEAVVPNYASQIKRGHKIKWDKKTYEVTGVNKGKYLGNPGISFSLRHASGSEHVTGVMDPLHHIARIAESTETLEEGNPATAILSTLMKKMKKYNDDSAAANKALQHALRTQSGKPRKADGMRPLERMEGFSDTIKKVGKNLAARPNKGSMPAAGRVKKMTEEEEMNEGKMKELSMDLEGPDSLPDKDFHAKYNRTKGEWHGLLGTKPKKPKAPKVVTPTVQKEEVDLDEATARGIARARKLSSYADQYKQRAADVRDKHPEEAMRHLRVASDWRRKAAAALAMREDTELDEATLPKYDPAKMDEFEAAKEFQYHAGRSAFHRNSQGWTGRLNDIYNRDWKKEASHHERHMKALKKVMDFHKTRKEEAEIDYPTLDEEVELHEGGSVLHKVKTMARK